MVWKRRQPEAPGTDRRPIGGRGRRAGPGPAAALLMAFLLGAAGCSRNAADGSDRAPGGSPAARPAERVVVAPIDPPKPPAPRPTERMALGAGCVTSQCHTSLATSRRVHSPVRLGECSICHEPDAGGHRFPLKHEGNDGCAGCHAVVGSRAHRHAAVDTGCVSCHDPHASDAPVLLRAESVEALCVSCHVLDRFAFPHGPNRHGECLACHEAHESDSRHLLRGADGPEHCFRCHAETRRAMESAPRLHAPARGDCLTCHDPHGSDHRHALHQTIDKNCFSCHGDIEKTVAGATSPHGAVFTGDGCANCHDPHASGRPSLLRDRQDVLCLGCHGRPIRAGDGRTIPDMTASIRDRLYLHGPVKSGDCSACHTVHGGSHARLLRKHFTKDFYASFDMGNYTLCFDCHESELVTTERTTTLTDFREGDLNLHFLHVNRDTKGRTCRACHDLHGSNLPRHVAESVPFGNAGWSLPIGFQMTETGGTCGPGCHEPQSYSRLGTSAPPGDQP